MNKLKTLLMYAALACVVVGCAGCAHLDAGADPVDVRASQVEEIAKSTFKTFLKLDMDNKELLKAKLPEAHKFANWLRQPVFVESENIYLPRNLAFVISLDDVRISYKQGKKQSGEVYAVIKSLQESLDQAASYSFQFGQLATK